MPFIANMLMRHIKYAINYGVAQIYVWRLHINLSAKAFFAVGELARRHTVEQIEVFLDRAVAVRAVLAGGVKIASVFAYLRRCQIIDIRLAHVDELYSAVVHYVKIVRSVHYILDFMTDEPLDVLDNRVDILHILFNRVGIIKAQIAHAAVFLSGAEIDRNRLCMADVQISVRLGRKTGVNLCVHAVFEILVDKSVNKVFRFLFFFDNFVIHYYNS